MSGVRSEGNQSSLIYLFRVQEVNILSSTFSECHSKNGEGGLFRITSAADLLIQNNSFSEISGGSGGVVYYNHTGSTSSSSSVKVLNNKFRNSVAAVAGGSLYLVFSI